MVTGTLFALMLIARLFPDTPSGQWLHRALVDEPLRLTAKLTGRDVLLCLVVLVACQGLALTMSADLALMMAADLSIYLEAMAGVWIAAGALRTRAAWAAGKRLARRARGGPVRLWRAGQGLGRQVRRRVRRIIERAGSNSDAERRGRLPAFA